MYTRHAKGFSLVEIVVGSAVLGVVFIGLISTYGNYIKASFQNAGTIKTTYLAEEGIEVLKTLRDKGWASNINSLLASTTYFLNFSGSTWMATTTPETIDALYSRSFAVYNVYRDGNSDIVTNPASGTLDPDTKKVVVSITYTPSATTSPANGTPDSPVLLSTTALCLSSYEAVVSGNYVFVICQNTIQVYDVSNPYSPVLVSTKTNPDNNTPLQQHGVILGNYLYVTVRNVNKLDVYDISNKNAIVRVASVATNQDPLGIQIAGTYAYLVNLNSNTLQAFDISDPVHPILTATVTTKPLPKDLVLGNGYAYVLDGWGGNYGWLEIFSLSNPTTPVLVGTSAQSALANYLDAGYLANGLLYTGSYGISGLQITQVSTPAAPTVIYTQPSQTIRNPPAVRGKNGYLYVAFDSYVDANNRSLQVWSIASTTLPVYIRSLPVPAADSIPSTINISGSYLYLLSGFDNVYGTLKIYGIGTDTTNQLTLTKTLSAYITNIFKN